MKKMILAVTILAVAGASVQTAKAGDREWAVAGKVLTGLLAASVITRALEPAPVYYSSGYYSYSAPDYDYSYSYRQAPEVVYVQPAPRPVVVYRAPVYVAAAPVYVSPAPVVSYRFAFGGGRQHHYRHGRW